MVEGDLGTLSLLVCTKSAEGRKSAFPLLVLEPESQQTAPGLSFVGSQTNGKFRAATEAPERRQRGREQTQF